MTGLRPSTCAAFGFAVVLACVAGLLTTARPATANDVFELSVISVRDSQIQMQVCLGGGDLLPAHISLHYTVSSPGSVILSGTWSAGGSGSTLLAAQRCPGRLTAISVTGLTASTTYTVDAVLTVAPRIEDDEGEYVVDASRPVIDSSDSITITTDVLPVDDEDATPSTATTPTASTPSGSGGPSAVPSAAPTTTSATPAPGPAMTADGLIVVVDDPGSLTAEDLAALTPEEVSTIEPADLRLIPPQAFTALSSDQMRALTPSQIRALRPAAVGRVSPASMRVMTATQFRGLRVGSLARLTVRQWSAVPRGTVRGLSSTTVRRLPLQSLRRIPPQSLHAMRAAQLRSLSARQVRALTRSQLRALTPRQASLLHEPAATHTSS